MNNETRYTKQVIVIRKDLNMRKGKMCAQAAHASMKVFLDNMEEIIIPDTPKNIIVKQLKFLGEDSPELDWLNGIFTKICVGVNSEEELVSIYEAALEACIHSALIEDNGLTEFKGVKTKTCCAIGPWWADEIDKITGHLKLL